MTAAAEPGQDQMVRLARFRRAHPDVIIGDLGFGGTWQARIPEPDGETVVTRHTLRELLDKLAELDRPPCQRCGIAAPPPDRTCGPQGFYHYVGVAAGCAGCGRLEEACAASPCSARRRGKVRPPGAKGTRP